MKLVLNSGLSDSWDYATSAVLKEKDGNTWCCRNEMTQVMFDEPDCRIDFVFFNKITFECEECKIVLCDPPYLSDHFGVMASLRSHLNVTDK